MNHQEKKKNLNNWIKFSQLGLQMAVTIAFCAFVGIWIDQKFPPIAPFGVAGLSLFGVFASLYNVIKQVNQMKD
ncbi:MAG: AtpZ/AtpI family protein [Capnocytophaga sp.]|nr:AtpZ/AtpI family protein [Capnocytophaga sp.]